MGSRVSSGVLTQEADENVMPLQPNAFYSLKCLDSHTQNEFWKLLFEYKLPTPNETGQLFQQTMSSTF